jgi:hypothetical protein
LLFENEEDPVEALREAEEGGKDGFFARSLRCGRRDEEAGSLFGTDGVADELDKGDEENRRSSV